MVDRNEYLPNRAGDQAYQLAKLKEDNERLKAEHGDMNVHCVKLEKENERLTAELDQKRVTISRLLARVERLHDAGTRSLQWLASYPGGCCEGAYRQMTEALEDAVTDEHEQVVSDKTANQHLQGDLCRVDDTQTSALNEQEREDER